jgi:hypothetical protein
MNSYKIIERVQLLTNETLYELKKKKKKKKKNVIDDFFESALRF